MKRKMGAGVDAAEEVILLDANDPLAREGDADRKHGPVEHVAAVRHGAARHKEEDAVFLPPPVLDREPGVNLNALAHKPVAVGEFHGSHSLCHPFRAVPALYQMILSDHGNFLLARFDLIEEF